MGGRIRVLFAKVMIARVLTALFFTISTRATEVDLLLALAVDVSRERGSAKI